MTASQVPSKNAPRILRLDWLEKQAETYRELGEARRNIARMNRAIRLEVAAHSLSTAIALHDVTAYQDGS